MNGVKKMKLKKVVKRWGLYNPPRPEPRLPLKRRKNGSESQQHDGHREDYRSPKSPRLINQKKRVCCGK